MTLVATNRPLVGCFAERISVPFDVSMDLLRRRLRLVAGVVTGIAVAVLR
jgi:hypothetical protein